MSITYTVNRSRKRRKTISLQVSGNSGLIVSAPYFTPVAEIDRFVREKQNWISKTIQKHTEDSIKNKAKKYNTGEHFFYLGQSYPLEVFFEPFENAGVVFWNNSFHLNAQENKDLRKHYFVSWYKKKAREYIHQHVYFFSRELNLQPGNLKITSAERRWGSCSADNNLSFSFRLIMAPPDIIDYVIVHELTHIKEKSHSPKFWKQVEAAMPEYKAHRRWLRDNNHKFIL
ncbi:MAG: SprT family zinc-dependent metalloprotease [Deltaproteobacteria bacterium]|nr:SprT family zinc-dependent metalloprotease [Deltaproteobacteria bacterium]